MHRGWQLTLLDVMGRHTDVHETAAGGSIVHLDLHNLPPGLYYLVFDSGEREDCREGH